VGTDRDTHARGDPAVGMGPAHFWADAGVAVCSADIAVRMRSILPVSAC